MRSLQEFSRAASWTLAARIAGSAAALLFNFLLARAAGAAGTGYFYICLTLVMLLSAFTRFGQDKVLMRRVSIEGSTDLPKSSSNFSVATLIALIVSLPVFVALFGLAGFVSLTFFHAPELVPIMKVMAVALLPTTFLFIFTDVLRVLGKSALAIWLQSGMTYFVACLFVVIGINFGFDVREIAESFLVASFLSLGVTLLVLKNAGMEFTRTVRSLGERVRSFLSEGRDLMFFALLMLLLSSADLILLGMLATPAEVGFYGIGAKLAIFISFVGTAANAVAEPRYAAHHSNAEFSAIEALIRKSEKFALIVALPLFLTYLIFATQILSIFGEDFIEGDSAFRLLAAGQFAALTMAPCAGVLVMCGRAELVRNICFGAVLLNIVLNSLLIPKYGATGAAIGTSTALITFYLLCALAIRSRFGINAIYGPRLKKKPNQRHATYD